MLLVSRKGLLNPAGDTLGIPLELVQDGNLAEHIECEVSNMLFAILKEGQIFPGSNIIPSFAVPNLDDFLRQLSHQDIKAQRPVIDLGEGKRVATISDPDGNAIRLIQFSAEWAEVGS